MTLVAIDAAGDAVGVVVLGPIDDELSATRRCGRTPWTWAWSFARKAGSWGSVVSCCWVSVDHLRLESTDTHDYLDETFRAIGAD